MAGVSRLCYCVGLRSLQRTRRAPHRMKMMMLCATKGSIGHGIQPQDLHQWTTKARFLVFVIDTLQQVLDRRNSHFEQSYPKNAINPSRSMYERVRLESGGHQAPQLGVGPSTPTSSSFQVKIDLSSKLPKFLRQDTDTKHSVLPLSASPSRHGVCA